MLSMTGFLLEISVGAGGCLVAARHVCLLSVYFLSSLHYISRIIQKRRKALRSQAQRVAQHLSVTTGHHVTYSLYLPSTVNSSSEATNTFMGVPHSTVPLESELQNAPPPAYSAAHQYPACTEPDQATSQKKDTFYGEEPTAESPPSYPE